MFYSFICSLTSDEVSNWFDDFLLLLDLSFECRWWLRSSPLSRRERLEDFLWWPWRDDERSESSRRDRLVGEDEDVGISGFVVDVMIFDDWSFSVDSGGFSVNVWGDSVEESWLVRRVFGGEEKFFGGVRRDER